MEKRALKFVSLIAVLILACAFGARAQQACDFPTAASRDAFLRFDRELRAALNDNDVGKVALLVSYPLRVNDPNGNYVIEDAASLARRINSVFTPQIREAVLAKSAQSLSCTPQGVLYGKGEVLVPFSEHGYGISTINIPGEDKRTDQVQFTCNFSKGRAVAEGSGDKNLKLRLWTGGRLLTDEPNVQITNGSSAMEGTQECAHRFWTFEKDGTHYRLEQLGCTDDTPPNNAVGRFESHNAGEPETSYCF
jgi:hypothetical protein